MNGNPSSPAPQGAVARLEAEAAAELASLDARSLKRTLRAMSGTGPTVENDGRCLANLASNDYLGLSIHPRLKAAAADAVERYGVGAGASRLVVGHLDIHEQAERAFASFKHAAGSTAGNATEVASLLLPTGYLANLAVLTTLAGPGDLICLDKLSHASLIDAAKASGAEVRAFPHLGYERLERLLSRRGERGASSVERAGSTSRTTLHALPSTSHAPRPPRTFLVTDSIFSMDGDAADLPQLCDLAERHDAILVVDDAHGTGVLGETGAGLAELQGVAGRVPITVSTASKALGGLGGVVTAARPVIDLLVNRARAFIYTTAVPPAQAAVLEAALGVVRDEPWRRERVLQWSVRLRAGLIERGWPMPATTVATPIIPLVVGDAAAALALAERLRDAGLLAVAIRPPTVAPGAARVRISLRADLDEDIVDRVLAAAGATA